VILSIRKKEIVGTRRKAKILDLCRGRGTQNACWRFSAQPDSSSIALRLLWLANLFGPAVVSDSSLPTKHHLGSRLARILFLRSRLIMSFLRAGRKRVRQVSASRRQERLVARTRCGKGIPWVSVVSHGWPETLAPGSRHQRRTLCPTPITQRSSPSSVNSSSLAPLAANRGARRNSKPSKPDEVPRPALGRVALCGLRIDGV
jgi:hypothetical protein